MREAPGRDADCEHINTPCSRGSTQRNASGRALQLQRMQVLGLQNVKQQGCWVLTWLCSGMCNNEPCQAKISSKPGPYSLHTLLHLTGRGRSIRHVERWKPCVVDMALYSGRNVDVEEMLRCRAAR